MKADKATTFKEILTFARILVEMQLNQHNHIEFKLETEIGKIVEQKIMYEWKQ